jgi:DNA polymerase III sliding clamp (beta) subunit (PCNA family)
MKVTVRVNEFKRVLEESHYVIRDCESGIPVLAYIKVEVDILNQATISGTTLGMSIVQPFEVVDGEPGSFLLPLKQTRELLKRHVGGTAIIETVPSDDRGHDRCVIKVGTFTMTFSSDRLVLFPRLDEMPKATHTISLKFLKRVVARVEAACPPKAGRHALSDIQLTSDGTRLSAVATDGNRIAIADAPGDWGTFSMQLPKDVVPVINRRVGATVQFAESEVNYFFRTDSGVVFQCRKPTKAFPNYRRALDCVFRGSIRVASAALKSTILGILSEKYAMFFFEVQGGTLQVSQTGLNTATGSTKVSAQGIADIGIKLNPRYVLDFLAQADGDVTMHFTHEDAPVRLSNGDNFRHFVMPGTSDAKLRRKKEEADRLAANPRPANPHSIGIHVIEPEPFVADRVTIGNL